MSLKHNPFDNSYKGTLVQRKKVFASPTSEELAVKINTEVPLQKIETKTSLEQHSNVSKSTEPAFENITKTETKTLIGTSLEQHSNIIKTNIGFSAVVGLQRKILDYFFNKAQSLGSRTTGKVYTEILAEILECSVETVRTSVQRLETKGFVIRQEFKRGRGGFSVFELGVETYQNLVIENNTQTLLKQNENNTRSQTKTETKTGSPIVVVSSNSINTTNTGAGEEPCFVIPNELNGKVSRRQLSEFVLSGKITESDLQLSLDAFAYDLKNKLVSSKYSSNPVSLLIGAIKNNGSYNSAKYIELLKSEFRPFIQDQRETTAKKVDIKNPKDWEEFQKFKLETPEDYKTLESKVSNYGFTGDLLEEFVFLEFKKVILKTETEEPTNPLRPPVSVNP